MSNDSGQPQQGNSPPRDSREVLLPTPLQPQPQAPHCDSQPPNGTQSPGFENGSGSSRSQVSSHHPPGRGDHSGSAEPRQPAAGDALEKTESAQSQFAADTLAGLAKELSGPSPGYVEVHGYLQLKDVRGGIPTAVLQAVGDKAIRIPQWGQPQPPRYKQQESATRMGAVVGNPPPGGTLSKRSAKAQVAFGKPPSVAAVATPAARPLVSTGRPPLPAHPPPALLANRRQTATPAPPKDTGGPQRPKRSPSVASAVRMTSFERMASEKMQALQAEGKTLKRPALSTALRKPKGPVLTKQALTLQKPEAQAPGSLSHPTPTGQPPPPASKTLSSAVAGRSSTGPGAAPARGRAIQKPPASAPKSSRPHPSAGQPVLVTMNEKNGDSSLLASAPDKPEEASESTPSRDSDRQLRKGLRRSASSVEIHRWPLDKKTADHRASRSPRFSVQQHFLPHRKVQEKIATRDVKKLELPSLAQRRRATVPALLMHRKAVRSGSSLLSGVSSNISRQRRATGSATAAATFVAKLLRHQNQRRLEPTKSIAEPRSSLHFLNKTPSASRATSKPPPTRGRYLNGVPPTTPTLASPKEKLGPEDLEKKPLRTSEKSFQQHTREHTPQKAHGHSSPAPGSRPRTGSPSPGEKELTATREGRGKSDKVKTKTPSPSVSSSSVRETTKRTPSPTHVPSSPRRTRKDLPTTALSVERLGSGRSGSREFRGRAADLQSSGGIRVQRSLPRSPRVAALQPSRHLDTPSTSPQGSDKPAGRRTRVPPQSKKATRRVRREPDLQTTDSEPSKLLLFSAKATGDGIDDDSPLLKPTRTPVTKEVGRRSRSPQTKHRASAASSLVSPLLAVQPARVRAASAPKLSSVAKRRPYTPTALPRSRSKTPSIVQHIRKPGIGAKIRGTTNLSKVSSETRAQQERDLRLIAEPVALLMSLDQAALHPEPMISQSPCPPGGSDAALTKSKAVKAVAISQNIRRESDTGAVCTTLSPQFVLPSDDAYAPLPAYFPPDLPPPLSPQPREVLPNPSYLRADLYHTAGRIGAFCSTQQQPQRQQGSLDLYENDLPVCSYAPGGSLSIMTPGFPITPRQPFADRGAGVTVGATRYEWPSELYKPENLISANLRPQIAVISPPTPFWGAPYIPPQPGRRPRASPKRDVRVRKQDASSAIGQDTDSTSARYYTPSRGSRVEDLQVGLPTPRTQRYHQDRPISTPYCYTLSPCCAPVSSSERPMESMATPFQDQRGSRQSLSAPRTSNEARIPRRPRRTRSTSYDSYADGTSNEASHRTQHRGVSNPVRLSRRDPRRYTTATQRVPTTAFCCYAPQHSASFGSQSATASHDAPSLTSLVDKN